MRSALGRRRHEAPSCADEINRLMDYLGYAVSDVAAADPTAHFLLTLCISSLRERRDYKPVARHNLIKLN
jgi:hypothetical protein